MLYDEPKALRRLTNVGYETKMGFHLGDAFQEAQSIATARGCTIFIECNSIHTKIEPHTVGTASHDAYKETLRIKMEQGE